MKWKREKHKTLRSDSSLDSKVNASDRFKKGSKSATLKAKAILRIHFHLRLGESMNNLKKLRVYNRGVE